MLDHLPLELIQLIVRPALPSRYSPLTYRERQDTLLALCKTSRAVLKAAQPLLFEVVELGTRRTLDNFLEAVKRKKLRHAVKALRLYADKIVLTDRRLLVLQPDDLAILFKRCQNVEALYTHEQQLDCAALEPLKKLRVLVVKSGRLISSRPAILPTLQYLSLDYLTTVGDLPRFALNEKGMPALQSLTLAGTLLSGSMVPLLPGLLAHVASLAIASALLERVETPVRTSPRVLTCASTYDIGSRTPSTDLTQDAALRVLDCAYLTQVGLSLANWWVKDTLDFLRVQLKAGTLPLLRYLYLPEEYLEFSASSQASLAKALKKLRKISRKRGVQIIYEPRWDPALDGLVAPEFLRRCRLLKEEEAEKEKREEDGGVGKE